MSADRIRMYGPLVVAALMVGTLMLALQLWPASYWKVWSDGIISRIHRQVLKHVKRLAEADKRDRIDWTEE